MNKNQLVVRGWVRFFVLKARRYALVGILVAVVLVTLLGNIHINAIDLIGVKRLTPRDVQLDSVATDYELYGDTNVNTTGVNNKDILTVRDRQKQTSKQITSDHKISIDKARPNDETDEESKAGTYPSDGYKRAEFLRKMCVNIGKRQSRQKVRVSYDNKHKALFCPLCKLASTFWTRVFKMLDNNNKGRLTQHPFEVPISQAPASKQYFDTSNQRVGNTLNAQNSFRFLFVRNPYSMLFSAFVDKIVGPNPGMWKAFQTQGTSHVKSNATNSCGAYITFEQFLRNVIQRYKTKHALDCHVAKFDACQPCAVNYTFVAKMETFKDDTFHIMYKLNQTKTLKVFEDQFSSLHADDAIDDSTSGPFLWKGGITKCITWSEALQRVWRKLQIRGVIGGDGFPLTDNEANSISQDKFIALLKNTRLKSTPAARSWQKEQAFIEAFRSVPTDVLEDIKHIYSEEFSLFDYVDSPNEIFDRDTNIQNYKLLDYTNIKNDIIRAH